MGELLCLPSLCCLTSAQRGYDLCTPLGRHQRGGRNWLHSRLSHREISVTSLFLLLLHRMTILRQLLGYSYDRGCLADTCFQGCEACQRFLSWDGFSGSVFPLTACLEHDGSCGVLATRWRTSQEEGCFKQWSSWLTLLCVAHVSPRSLFRNPNTERQVFRLV